MKVFADTSYSYSMLKKLTARKQCQCAF